MCTLFAQKLYCVQFKIRNVPESVPASTCLANTPTIDMNSYSYMDIDEHVRLNVVGNSGDVIIVKAAV